MIVIAWCNMIPFLQHKHPTLTWTLFITPFPFDTLIETGIFTAIFWTHSDIFQTPTQVPACWTSHVIISAQLITKIKVKLYCWICLNPPLLAAIAAARFAWDPRKTSACALMIFSNQHKINEKQVNLYHPYADHHESM